MSKTLWICLGLIALVFAVYSGVGTFQFVNLDDPDFVYNNAHVRGGLTAEGLRWAFTSTEAANWMPLTRISQLIDVQLFGLDAGWHHWTNVALHAAATLLLFAFLQAATGTSWRSAFVAAVFAVHPLHAESVAWVSERKDVLYAVFWFAGLWAYVAYVRRPDLRRYVTVVALFVLGLMSKPMMITFPFVLLLMDVWPLARTVGIGRLVREKIPLFLLVVAAALITLWSQSAAGAVKDNVFPITTRLANAIVSCLAYVGATIWPAGLAVFYPYPSSVNVVAVIAGLALIGGVSVLAVRWIRVRPYFAVGWSWYLGTLVPVIGIVQAGDQARADRYMYVPMIGLLIIAAWGASELGSKRPAWKKGIMAAGVAACVALALLASRQIGYWRNTETLYTHAIEATDNNYMAHNALGGYLVDYPQRVPDAAAHFEAALRMKPDYAAAHRGLGLAFARTPGRENDALTELETAVRLAPNLFDARNNLGAVLLGAGRPVDAAAQFREAIRLRPDSADAHSNLAAALANTPGRADEALAEYSEALRLDPNLAEAHFTMGALLARLPGRAQEAVEHLRAAVRLSPDFDTHFQLALALEKMPGGEAEAMAELQTAAQLNPQSAEVRTAIEELRSRK